MMMSLVLFLVKEKQTKITSHMPCFSLQYRFLNFLPLNYLLREDIQKHRNDRNRQKSMKLNLFHDVLCLYGTETDHSIFLIVEMFIGF